MTKLFCDAIKCADNFLPPAFFSFGDKIEQKIEIISNFRVLHPMPPA